MNNMDGQPDTTGLEIAVIGMAVRFPDAGNIDEFWANLDQGVHSVRFFTDDQLMEKGVPIEISERPDFVKTNGATLAGKELFDAAFFGYIPDEAREMDPQIRIFHEVVWHALENAAYDPLAYKGLIGLYAGASPNFYWEALAKVASGETSASRLGANYGGDKDFLATRISYNLNLRGPSINLQTACSTGLVAIHLACQALLSGECDMALAGGVGISTRLTAGYIYQKGMISSPDGLCRSFDAASNGTTGGEGAGVVLLKPLEEALEGKDYIHAVIKGSALNNDGKSKVGFTAPSTAGQAGVIRSAYRAAGVDLGTISYIEAHGSGTSLGDTIEVEALKLAFGSMGHGAICLGSVKTNIGHLDAAAGIAGFIKTVLTLKNRKIPGTLHFETPNPNIDFENSPFYVSADAVPLHEKKFPLRAGVSSFGIGGTNAHIVIEEAPLISSFKKKPKNHPHLIPLSAKSEEALDENTADLAGYLAGSSDIDIADLAYTLQVGRADFRFRRFMIAKDVDELKLTLQNETSRGIVTSCVQRENPPVVFMFAGQGSQYPGMALHVYREFPQFKSRMDSLLDIAEGLGAGGCRNYLLSASNDDMNKIEGAAENSQLIIFMFEYAVARLLMDWGIRPDTVIGYSFGEYVAACVAGVFSAEDIMKVIWTRENLVQAQPVGGMLSVPMTHEEAAPFLTGDLSLAIDNGESCVLSGPLAELAKIEETLKSRRMLGVRLNIEYAAHSQLMAPAVKDLVGAVKGIRLSKGDIPAISGITGNFMTESQALDPGYWGEHLKRPTLFYQGICKLLDNETVFIEIGAGWDLCALVGRIVGSGAANRLVSLVPPAQKKQSPLDFWWKKIGQLWGHGITVDWAAVARREARYRLPLPGYPFQRQDFTLPERYHRQLLSGGGNSENTGTLRKRDSIDEWLYIATWKQSPAFSPAGITGPAGTVYLVFLDDMGFGEGILHELKQHDVTVISVTRGAVFAASGPDSYSVDPLDKSSYLSLAHDLKHRGLLPTRVIHTWSFDTSSSSLGLLSLVHWAAALGIAGDETPVKTLAISNGMQEVTGEESLDPLQSTVLGAVRVMGQEYLHMDCISLDISLPEPQPALTKQWAVQCIAELESESPDTHIAYRGRHRWIQSFESITPWKVGTPEYTLRQRGIYLVTGGLGYVGGRIASYLAKKTGGTLILTGRSPLTGKMEKRLAELRDLGAAVAYYPVDVGDKEQMNGLLISVLNEYGTIHGVVHAAGIPGGQLFKTMKDVAGEDIETQYRAKVIGPQVLADVFKDQNLDFCLLTTSIASVLGALGNSIYTAANRFADAFAVYQNQILSKQVWCSIDWDHWNDIDESEGIRLLDQMFSMPLPGRLIVSPLDLNARIRQWDKASLSADQMEDHDKHLALSQRQDRPMLTTPFVAAQTPLEQKLADIWAQFFGFTEVGVEDEFFELGGDSLKAMTVLLKINRSFDVEVPLSELFRLSTVRGMAGYIKSASKEESQIISPVEKKEYYSVSSAQKRMFLLQQIMPDTIGYNELSVVSLQGDFSLERFQEAVRSIIQRHECFRTSFFMVEGQPVQKILAEADFSIERLDFKESVDACIDGFVRPFDLSVPPHVRIAIVPQKEDQCFVLLDAHHIVFDGVSKAVFVEELMRLLEGESLPPITLQYKDYAEWQHRCRDQLKKQEAYWLDRFSGSIPSIQLPLDHPRPAVQDFSGGAVGFAIGQEETDVLIRVGRDNGITLYMMLVGIFSIFLSKLSRQHDVIVGTPTAGRGNLDISEIIGIFVNTICVRTHVDPGIRIIDYLHQVKETTLQAFENQDFQFEDLVEQLLINRDTGRNPLFDVLFVFHNVDGPVLGHPRRGSGELVSSTVNVAPRISKFDLTLNGEERNREIVLKFEYSTALFQETTMLRFVDYFKRIVSAVVNRPDTLISSIQLLDDEQRRQVLHVFNETAGLWPNGATLLDIYRGRLDRGRDDIALLDGNSALNAGQFHNNARRVAGDLQKRGFAPGMICAIKAERSMQMIVGIYAVILAGGAYLPVDAAIPDERLSFILKDSGCNFLLVDAGKTRSHSLEVEILELLLESGSGDTHLAAHASIYPETPAYIIYTSGSTGVPKGVVVEHRSVVNILSHLEELYPLAAGDAYLLKTNVTFDVSVTEIFSWIFGNGALAIPRPGIEKDVDALIDFIKRAGVTHANFVPSQLSVFIDYLRNSEDLKGLALKYIFAAGEAFFSNLAEILKQLQCPFRVDNIYGPTEGTIYATGYSLEDFSGNHWVPIGKPLKNIHCYILDPEGQPLPMLVPGELYLGGECVARGYLNRPQLTDEQFVKPVAGSGIDDGRLYRTGDIARWLEDGNIQYLGRVDHQVKIRGYRIELGEIENRMMQHPQIREAVVITRYDQSGDVFLCSFYTMTEAKNKGPLANETLLEFMARSLPEYMLPAHCIEVEDFDRTTTGKVDRRALETYRLPTHAASSKPINSLEERLLALWADVLGIGEEAIGRTANFFQTGGHSLKMASLLAKIAKTIGIKLSMMEAFHAPTIAGMARILREKGYEMDRGISFAEERDYYPVSPSQRRLYILQQIDPEGTAYHLPEIVSLPQNADLAGIEAAFERLIQYHESLRTSFHVVAGQTVQRIHKRVDFKIERHELDPATQVDGGRMREFIRPFDLAVPPLLRVASIKTAVGECLLVDMHHIISDGVSHRVLVNDFQAFFEGRGTEPPAIQYRDYCVWLQEELGGNHLENHRDFWLRQFDAGVPVLELPVDFQRPPVQSFAGRTIGFKLSQKDTADLYRLARDNDATLYMALLAMYSFLLSRLSGQNDLVIGTPVAGRGHAELERVIGVFINMMPMHCIVRYNLTFEDYLSHVREQSLAAFDHQGYPFDLLVDQLEVRRDTSRNPVFDAALMLQNFYRRNDGVDSEGSLQVEHGTSKFDITLYVEEGDRHLSVAFEYCTQLFKDETIERFAGYFREIVAAVCSEPHALLADISILPEQERKCVLEEFNQSAGDYPKNDSVFDLFKRQAEEAPDRSALVFERRWLTYAGLLESALNIGGALRQTGFCDGDIAAIVLDRSAELLVAILGVMAVGGAYLYLDPAYPEQRKRFMLDDSVASVAICSAGDDINLPAGCRNFSVDTALLNRGGAAWRPQAISPESAVYLSYTSGSTGKPKGVVILHRSVVNFIHAMLAHIPLTSADRVLSLTTASFDIFVLETLLPLGIGARVVLGSRQEQLDIPLAAKTLIRHDISLLQLTPSRLQLWVSHKESAPVLGRIDYLVAGGEAFPQTLAEQLVGVTSAQIYNVYGPTETTVWSTICPVVPGRVPTIGKPLLNNRIYILGDDGTPQPIGVPGELFIAGDGLASGYLNRPELTDNRFVSPVHVEEERLYRTGDLARWLADGTIEFIGRIDNQVKLRGFRIELGEIQSCLLAHPDIREVAVLLKNAPGGPALGAYLVADREFSVAQLRQFLSDSLPDYMIPAFFVTLEEIPLTPNGKTDIRRLRQLDERVGTGTDYIAPEAGMEQDIASIWRDVLGVDKIGSHDNFFALGGNSMGLIQVSEKLSNLVGRQVPVVTLYRFMTVHTLAKSFAGEAGDTMRKQGVRDRKDEIDKGKARLKNRMKRKSR